MLNMLDIFLLIFTIFECDFSFSFLFALNLFRDFAIKLGHNFFYSVLIFNQTTLLNRSVMYQKIQPIFLCTKYLGLGFME